MESSPHHVVTWFCRNSSPSIVEPERACAITMMPVGGEDSSVYDTPDPDEGVRGPVPNSVVILCPLTPRKPTIVITIRAAPDALETKRIVKRAIARPVFSNVCSCVLLSASIEKTRHSARSREAGGSLTQCKVFPHQPRKVRNRIQLPILEANCEYGIGLMPRNANDQMRVIPIDKLSQ